MKFFVIAFVLLVIGAVVTSCFTGYAPFLGKLATALMWLSIAAGIVTAVLIGLYIYDQIRKK